MPDLQQKMPKARPGSRVEKTRSVAILVYDGLCTFEYGIVAEVFGLHRPELGGYLYDVASVAVEKRRLRAADGLVVSANGRLSELESAHTVVIPGWRGKDQPVPRRICSAVRGAHERGARLVSICSGIYVLAAAGLLANRPATTHWQYVQDFAARYPDVHVQLNELYVDDGDIITSAGSAAGIDACLHVVRKDHGARIANAVARRMVMHGHRQGGQAQFIEQPLPKADGRHRLSALMDDIRASLGVRHSVSSLASRAGMSTRTFQRRFRAFTGVSVMRWLAQERLSRACLLLETSDHSLDHISEAVGFGAPEAMRYRFRQALRISPIEYRRRFHQASSQES